MIRKADTLISRKVIYFAMIVLMAAIFFGARHETSPIFLAVGFIGEIILVSTAHLSSVIQQSGLGRADGSST